MGATTAAFLPQLDWPQRALVAWCAGILVYLMLAWWLCHRFDAARTRSRAQAQDEPSVVIFLLLLLANLACVVAITQMMQDIDALKGLQRGLVLGLLFTALALSWLFIQALFTFHYAHRYYQTEERQAESGPGLQFPGERDPDYFDFLYYAHVVGMTSQVSDVKVISAEMRRITLVHSVLAFGFNMLVFALAINLVAGLLR
ncbi:MAG: DUF1345 domain-containing protein [Polaromonas sp.]|nr:DUF1345 domain-containing protein [Polaromonas sp.]